MMSDLSREAREALQAFRAEERPTSSQRERIWSEVEADAADERWEHAVPRSGGTLRQWLMITVAAAAIALLAISWLQGRVARERDTDEAAMGAPYDAETSAEPITAQPRSPRSQGVTEPDVDEPPGSPTEVVEPEAKPEAAKAPSPKAPRESLEAESELIAEAKAALDRGDAGRALDLVERHRRDFPSGQMGEEASRVRAQALCDLGRIDESREEARRFLDAWPDSQYRARMLRVCVQRPTGR
jgi:hypothetical protein